MGPQNAKDFFKNIRTHAGAIDREERRQIEWISQGRYAILLAPSSGALAQLTERGVKVGVLPELKDYGSYLSASFGTAQLVNKAPHPNAAAVFINWLLTKDGQTIWSKTMDHVSRRVDVTTDHLPPYIVPRPGVKYRLSWLEEEQHRSDEEVQVIKETFGK
jgi:ABC-type Fe3+ transport system substrate-binding protein